MKKLILLGMLAMSVVAFSQTLSKEQEKEVKKINKETKKQVDKIVDNEQLSAGEKKVQVQTAKNDRDQKIKTLSPVAVSDPIEWDKAINKIEKQEAKRLKAEEKSKIDALEKQKENLKTESENIDQQINTLKEREKEIDAQLDQIKHDEKVVKEQYK